MLCDFRSLGRWSDGARRRDSCSPASCWDERWLRERGRVGEGQQSTEQKRRSWRVDNFLQDQNQSRPLKPVDVKLVWKCFDDLMLTRGKNASRRNERWTANPQTGSACVIPQFQPPPEKKKIASVSGWEFWFWRLALTSFFFLTFNPLNKPCVAPHHMLHLWTDAWLDFEKNKKINPLKKIKREKENQHISEPLGDQREKLEHVLDRYCIHLIISQSWWGFWPQRLGATE